jgi:hypothetical protein
MHCRRSLALLLLVLLLSPGAQAAWNPAELDLARRRLLFRAADLPGIQARIAKEPWRSVVAAMLARSALADGVALDASSAAGIATSAASRSC